MLQSLWNYLRKRTRDSLLLGVNDAMNAIEQGHGQESGDPAATLTARIAVVVETNGNGKAFPLESPKTKARR